IKKKHELIHYHCSREVELLHSAVTGDNRRLFRERQKVVCDPVEIFGLVSQQFSLEALVIFIHAGRCKDGLYGEFQN
ncbi:hypothetical protein DKP78_22640, partial [Enterococcus faecium]